MKNRLLQIIFICICFAFSNIGKAQTADIIKVQANKPGVPIQPSMYGVFFEDINFAADGGLYAELVKNRSFEFATPLMAWKPYASENNKGRLQIHNRENDNTNNPRFLHIIKENETGAFGLENEGFRGIGFKKDSEYKFSILAKMLVGSLSMKIELLNAKGEVIGTSLLSGFNGEWKKYKTTIKSSATEQKGSLRISLIGKGELDVDMISLFPADTWKKRENGLRADLVQLLADMKPGFVRFPGGCIVEGRDLANRYQWKQTVGNVDNRKLIVNRWNTEFLHRPTPDYYQSYGLGFFEYFLLCEDIGAEPLPILNCGMACQFNTAELVPLDKLSPYIQDALDLIEFANGDVNTKWGKLRTEMGHPAPFNLKMMGVGNEQWDVQYIERSKIFTKAIKEKYPQIKIVGTVGPSADGELFEYAWKELIKEKAEIIDEHYYQKPEWFLQNVKRYDNYDRKGPKVFAGEYAAQSKFTCSPDNSNNWLCALSEAAFMTGLERNADVVVMTSYAPLFAHTEAWQWRPDLIWFDNLSSFGTPNYFVQKLFSLNKGNSTVPIELNGVAITGQDSLFASACFDAKTNEIIVKLVNVSTNIKEKQIDFEGCSFTGKTADLTILSNASKNAENSIEKPMNIAPKTQTITLKGKSIKLKLEKLSFTILKIAVKK